MALSSEAPVGVLLASAARAADAYSDPQTNDVGYRGVLITMVTSTEVGACTVAPTVEFYDDASAGWVTAMAGTNITTETTTTWQIYPGTTVTGGDYTVETMMALPLVWRLFWNQTSADTSTGFTVSAGYQYLP